MAGTFPSLAAAEIAVKEVLNSVGVSVLQMADYFGFGREVWSISQKDSGEMLAVNTAGLVNKWVTRGLNRTVLEKIRKDAFGIESPQSTL